MSVVARNLTLADDLLAAYESFCREVEDAATRYREAIPGERMEAGAEFLLCFHTASERLRATTSLAALDYQDRERV